jgi:hypothetical protein
VAVLRCSRVQRFGQMERMPFMEASARRRVRPGIP